MPADLIPQAKIPEVAARVSSDQLKVLRRIQKAGFIMNSKEIDRETTDALQQLAGLDLVDPGYQGATRGQPYMWVSNGNGLRVLRHLTGLRGGPFYEIPAPELAAWLEEQGKDRWWTVDGDPLLTGRQTFPCPADDLAEEFRKVGQPLLVKAKKDDTEAKGQVIGKEKLNAVVDRLTSNLHVIRGEMPPGSGDRMLYLCWKGKSDEWLLTEDSETTALMEAEEKGQGNDAVRSAKE